MLLGLIGALLAAFCYGLATVLQAVGVRRFAAVPAGVSLLVRIREGRSYLTGLAFDGLGFVASLLALRTLPLFVVQSAIAASVAVTAVLAVMFLGARLRRAEVAALVVVGLGLVGLAIAGSSGAAKAVPTGAAVALLLAIVPTALLAAWALTGKRAGAAATSTAPAGSVVALSVAAGIGFAGVGIAARIVVIPHPLWMLVGEPTVWALIGFAVLSAVCYACALARGAVTVVAALSLTIETVLPAVVGLVWLGDGVRAGFDLVAALGFCATVGGCLALARYAEVSEVDAPAPG